MKRRAFLGLLLPIAMAPPGICAQSNPDFSGTWKQSNERSTPRRMGNVTLKIDHRDPELTVATTILRGSASPRRALQQYSTDGKVSTSTGADGDQFHTSIVWMGQSLVFMVEEHEDGRVLRSQETWTLIENGAALERVREPLSGSPDGAGKQTLIYLREAPQS
jgi:hypothetical protein